MYSEKLQHQLQPAVFHTDFRPQQGQYHYRMSNKPMQRGTVSSCGSHNSGTPFLWKAPSSLRI